MTYSDLPIEDQILLSVGFVGRGLTVPNEIRANLGEDLIRDIEYPETTNGRDNTS